MKVLHFGKEVDISAHIHHAETLLLREHVYLLKTSSHIEHIAAYVAWTRVGGNIFLMSPFLPKDQVTALEDQLKKYKYTNSICFHTSGTTGTPKLVVHKRHQLEQARKMSTAVLGWDSDTKFLNFLPPFTSGFWNIVIPSLVYHDCEIVLGSRETIAEDLKQNTNLTVIVPAMLDMMRIHNIEADFSKFKRVGSGSSAVLPRHVEFIFKNKANRFTHMYGTTEIGVPILSRDSNSFNDFSTYLEINANGDNQTMLVDNELYVKGESLCENIEDFSNVDGWFKTNDIFVRDGDLIKFAGRNNDIVKINGYQANLLLIENTLEDKFNLGDTLAVVKNSMGVDYVELFYTNDSATIDKNEIHKSTSNILPECNIPRKYTHVDSIPRNSMGKKIRNAL